MKDMNNSKYWEEGWASENCVFEEFFFIDNSEPRSACEQVTKRVTWNPYHHGNWSDLVIIPTKPTDRFQLFENQGMIDFGIALEIRQNKSENVGIVDFFIDDFLIALTKNENDIPQDLLEQLVNENRDQIPLNIRIPEEIAIVLVSGGGLGIGIGLAKIVRTKRKLR